MAVWVSLRVEKMGKGTNEKRIAEDAAHLSNIGFPLPFIPSSSYVGCGGCNDCVCSEFWVRLRAGGNKLRLWDGRNLSERADERTKAEAAADGDAAS